VMKTCEAAPPRRKRGRAHLPVGGGLLAVLLLLHQLLLLQLLVDKRQQEVTTPPSHGLLLPQCMLGAFPFKHHIGLCRSPQPPPPLPPSPLMCCNLILLMWPRGILGIVVFCSLPPPHVTRHARERHYKAQHAPRRLK